MIRITRSQLRSLILAEARKQKTLQSAAARAERLMSYDCVKHADSMSKPSATREQVAAAAADYCLETSLTGDEYDALDPEYAAELRLELIKLALGWL